MLDYAVIFVLFLNKIHCKSPVHNEIEGKIVGGQPTGIENFPSSVQLYNHGSMCGGVILNSWTIVTAAHCFVVGTDVTDISVQVGARYLWGVDGVEHTVVAIDINDRYNSTSFENDVALVFLEKPIKHGQKAKKALIVNNEDWMHPKYGNFEIVGWGRIKYAGEISQDGARMVKLKYTSKKKCEDMFKPSFPEPIPNSMFCLYGNGTKDTCMGDSGNGVYWKGYLVGIVSHGDKCGEMYTPSVYLNVYRYRKWIEERIEAYFELYCEKENENKENTDY